MRGQLRERTSALKSLNLKNFELLEENNRIKKEICIIKSDLDFDQLRTDRYDDLFENTTNGIYSITPQDLQAQLLNIGGNNRFARQSFQKIPVTDSGANFSQSPIPKLMDFDPSTNRSSPDEGKKNILSTSRTQLQKSSSVSGKQNLKGSPSEPILANPPISTPTFFDNTRLLFKRNQRDSRSPKTDKENLFSCGVEDDENLTHFDDISIVESQVNSLLNRIEKKQAALRNNYSMIDRTSHRVNPNSQHFEP